jgi:hypothetical protein
VAIYLFSLCSGARHRSITRATCRYFFRNRSGSLAALAAIRCALVAVSVARPVGPVPTTYCPAFVQASAD